jgi:hypothetical protein
MNRPTLRCGAANDLKLEHELRYQYGRSGFSEDSFTEQVWLSKDGHRVTVVHVIAGLRVKADEYVVTD